MKLFKSLALKGFNAIDRSLNHIIGQKYYRSRSKFYDQAVSISNINILDLIQGGAVGLKTHEEVNGVTSDLFSEIEGMVKCGLFDSNTETSKLRPKVKGILENFEQNPLQSDRNKQIIQEYLAMVEAADRRHGTTPAPRRRHFN